VPSRCSRSKKYGVSAAPTGLSGAESPPAPSAATARRAPRVAARLEVSWNGRGRPAGSSAITSPSSTISRAGSARTAATTAGSRGVISSRLRVNTATSSPERCTWIRIPSSFTSTTAGTPVVASASATLDALCASIGASGRPTCSANAASALAPPVSAATATVFRSPASSSARRTAASSTPAALATASTSSPACAPWRSSPVNSPRSITCSSEVAAAKSLPSSSRRRPWAPVPLTAAISPTARSTSSTVRVGTSAGGGRPRRLAQPTPVCRCRSSPAR